MVCFFVNSLAASANNQPDDGTVAVEHEPGTALRSLSQLEETVISVNMGSERKREATRGFTAICSRCKPGVDREKGTIQ